MRNPILAIAEKMQQPIKYFQHL